MIDIAVVGGNAAVGVEAAGDWNDTLWRQSHPVRVVVHTTAVHLLFRYQTTAIYYIYEGNSKAHNYVDWSLNVYKLLKTLQVYGKSDESQLLLGAFSPFFGFTLTGEDIVTEVWLTKSIACSAGSFEKVRQL